MAKIRVKIAGNGILVENAMIQVGYSVFSNTVRLSSVCDDYTFYSESDEEWNVSKNLEPLLTERYGKLYCPKHSRLIKDGHCDLCDDGFPDHRVSYINGKGELVFLKDDEKVDY